MKINFNYDLAQKRVKLAISVVILLREVVELYHALGVVINYPELTWSGARAGSVSLR